MATNSCMTRIRVWRIQASYFLATSMLRSCYISVTFPVTFVPLKKRNAIRPGFVPWRKCLTFYQIPRRPSIVERWNHHRSTRHVETNRMAVVSSFYDHWMPRYSAKCQMAQYHKCKNAEFWTFCQISRHPVVVKGWNHCHSIRLDMTSRMMVVLSFYQKSVPIRTGPQISDRRSRRPVLRLTQDRSLLGLIQPYIEVVI